MTLGKPVDVNVDTGMYEFSSSSTSRHTLCSAMYLGSSHSWLPVKAVEKIQTALFEFTNTAPPILPPNGLGMVAIPKAGTAREVRDFLKHLEIGFSFKLHDSDQYSEWITGDIFRFLTGGKAEPFITNPEMSHTLVNSANSRYSLGMVRALSVVGIKMFAFPSC